ncbi:DNA topoisomerase I [Desulfacinum hydrothermale DSM 13146]|uniref:DNA topoisomerase 1 n=1 Tax=Desulfacinum hydrothermale DSM 13146 TaxID=1121390 RepID=A0A1W1XMJ8_9BACT|nr:type I DNA topoisomerase [Desulfacinum hydrothermale]SMC25219.1 DNA topoisomerase I [Desulfacinum hydrothermale DSM 13146]
MAKSLLIVESPTKARTLNRYLGKDFIVKASVGHVKDLPKTKLGIDVEHQFKPQYQVIRGKKKVLKELSEAAAKADAIYLGPDPDREGEAIAWHIAEELKANGKPVHRVLFYELTHRAIKEALQHPGQLNRNLYDAQQARRILDRLVGYLISPLLWEKVRRGLSAGRVQSVALRLVCEREREIQRFEPQEYWSITAHLAKPSADDASGGPQDFLAKLWRIGKKKAAISTEKEASAIVGEVQGRCFRVQKVDKKRRQRKAPAPFITSTLQQEAARKLRFAAKKTMRVAQRLYEGVELGEEGAVGLITYMRTDSTRLADEAVKAVRDYIGQAYGKEYLPGRPVVYKTKSAAQDAHEAIRPTDVFRTPESVKDYLGRDEWALYNLIWKRFVACQMAPARIFQTSVDIEALERQEGGKDGASRKPAVYVFRAVGSVIEFPGFMVLYTESKDEDDKDSEDGAQRRLPDLKEGDLVDLNKLIPKQHFTQPPSRYTEASLIRELEERGVGRPSTYATILSTIVDRDYVKQNRRQLRPTELGLIINDLLVQHFPDIVDVEFTAKMEKTLDEVEQGTSPYIRVLEEFYSHFQKTLSEAQKEMRNLRVKGLPTGLTCPQCGKPLHIRFSRNGPFLACMGYPDCTFSSNYERDEKGAIRMVEQETTDQVCDKCGSPMVVKRGRYGDFLACSAYPKCKNTMPIGLGIPCPREGCDGELVERLSKRGRKFYGCNRYPDCDLVLWNRPVKITCPQCGSPAMVERVNKKGDKTYTCARPGCGYKFSDS